MAANKLRVPLGFDLVPLTLARPSVSSCSLPALEQSGGTRSLPSFLQETPSSTYLAPAWVKNASKTVSLLADFTTAATLEVRMR